MENGTLKVLLQVVQILMAQPVPIAGYAHLPAKASYKMPPKLHAAQFLRHQSLKLSCGGYPMLTRFGALQMKMPQSYTRKKRPERLNHHAAHESVL
jgi:hypothetical protein